MMSKETASAGSLEERLRERAEGTVPDKVPAAICQVIEVRRVLSEQRLRGHSWASLAQMLADVGLNLTAGTLRNYMRQIGRAEAYLHDAGKSDASDSEIHAALRRMQAAPRRPAAPSPQLAKIITPDARASPPTRGIHASPATTTHDPHENL